MTTFTPTMSVIEAICRRRAARSYTGALVDDETVHALLGAAVQAPTALHSEPWAFAVSALSSPEWKASLGIPDEMTAFASIIVGMPTGDTPPVPRKAPEILCWR